MRITEYLRSCRDEYYFNQFIDHVDRMLARRARQALADRRMLRWHAQQMKALRKKNAVND